MQRTLTRNVRKLAVGQVAYSAMCFPHGGMIDDGTLFRHGPDQFRWIGGDDYGGIWLKEQAKAFGLDVQIKPATEQIHNLSVQGPRSREILREVVWTPPGRPSVDELGWFRFTVGRIGGYQGIPIVLSRTGYTGELGFEVFATPRTGRRSGTPSCRRASRSASRPWAWRHSTWCGSRPGWSSWLRVRQHHRPVRGRHRLRGGAEGRGLDRPGRWRRKAHLKERLVGLELTSNEATGKGDPVFFGRAQIGHVTSATRSPVLKKNLALARLDVAHADLDGEVEIGKLDGLQKRLPATVVKFPFYDPGKTRVRA